MTVAELKKKKNSRKQRNHQKYIFTNIKKFELKSHLLFIYLFIYSFVHLFIYLFVYLFILRIIRITKKTKSSIFDVVLRNHSN